MKFSVLMLAVCTGMAFTSCKEKPSGDTAKPAKDSATIVTASVTYKADTTDALGYVAYDANKEGKRPVVLIVPEWWGVTDYVKERAKQLAALGYLAFVVDMYGRGQVAEDPQQAGAMAGPFYANPALGKQRLTAAWEKARTYPEADTLQTAAIGYCFGGSMVLNAAKMGVPFNGVVSFHGTLAGGVAPVKDSVRAQILVCNGAADSFVKPEDIASFKKQLDSAKVKYTFKDYEGATHAFTNPAATENGKKFNMPIAYNAAADSASWKDMTAFFGKIFK